MRNPETCPWRPCNGADCVENGEKGCPWTIQPTSSSCGSCAHRIDLGGVDCSCGPDDPGCTAYTPFNENDFI